MNKRVPSHLDHLEYRRAVMLPVILSGSLSKCSRFGLNIVIKLHPAGETLAFNRTADGYV